METLIFLKISQSGIVFHMSNYVTNLFNSYSFCHCHQKKMVFTQATYTCMHKIFIRYNVKQYNNSITNHRICLRHVINGITPLHNILLDICNFFSVQYFLFETKIFRFITKSCLSHYKNFLFKTLSTHFHQQ